MDGSHTLDITLTNISSSDVFLDYLIYEASQNSTLETSSRLLILDTSPNLAYSGGWNPGIVGLRSGLVKNAVSLNDSVEGAADLGATVALNFTGACCRCMLRDTHLQLGSGFEVHGLMVTPFPSPVASYSLDGGPWMDVQMPPNGTSFFNAVSNFPFIGQTFNEVSTHSLVITPLIPAAFFLDYIIVESPTAFFPPKAEVALSPSATTSSLSAGASSTTSVTSKPVTQNRSGLQAGAIVGAVLGITVCFGLAFLGWYLLRRQRSRRANGERADATRTFPSEFL